MTAPIRYCEAPDCFRVARGRYCEGHRKRLRRGGDVSAPLRAPLRPWDAFIEAVLMFSDAPANDDDEYHRRREAMRKAAKRWARVGDA